MSVQDSYDNVAERYFQTFQMTLDGEPLERGLLAAFAELVKTHGGPVADLGCGPGHITAHLAALGLPAFGIDLSPAMIELARTAHPGLRFEVGSMDALDIADASVSGVLSRWSIVHTPPAEVPAILAEFGRVLSPGGHLLICFPSTDDAAQKTLSYDHSVATAYQWWPDHLSALLRDAGLEEVGRLVERPKPDDKRQFLGISLLARRVD